MVPIVTVRESAAVPPWPSDTVSWTTTGPSPINVAEVDDPVAVWLPNDHVYVKASPSTSAAAPFMLIGVSPATPNVGETVMPPMTGA
jgi:hypothetical protein